MDEKEKIMEKRSSFRGWKERNKGRIPQKTNIIVILVIIVIFSALIIYPYWNKEDNLPIKDKKKISSSTPVKKVNLSNSSKNQSLKTVNITKKVTNTTNTTKKVIIGKIGAPLVNNGFQITIKSITPTSLYINVWILVKNIENKEKQFKLGSGTIMIDNIGQQYENIKVARSTEIFQTNLSAKSIREGSVFFEKLKEGRNPKKLILDINGQKVEFMINKSNSSK